MSLPNPQLPSRSMRHGGVRRKPRRVLYGILGLFLIAGLAAIGYAAYLYFVKVDGMINTIGTEEEVTAENSASVKPLSILVLGLDSRPETGSLNTDVIMAAALNPKTQSATVVSIPRDTYVKSMLGLRSNKANAFYPNLVAGNPKTANAQIKQVFGKLLGVQFDYVALIKFQGFADVVDALGGITVDVDMDMRYVDKADGTNINLKKGVQKLKGQQALDFVRYRKSNNGTAESSDLERNARQQLVVAEVLGKLKSAGGIAKLGSVFDAVGKNVVTDIPSSQMKDLVRTYMGIEKDNINYIHLVGEWKSPYVYVSDSDWANARQALRQKLE